jgi:hypothetical protein
MYIVCSIPLPLVYLINYNISGDIEGSQALGGLISLNFQMSDDQEKELKAAKEVLGEQAADRVEELDDAAFIAEAWETRTLLMAKELGMR